MKCVSPILKNRKKYEILNLSNTTTCCCQVKPDTIYCGCEGRTSKEQWMRVPYGEELETHTGPASSVDSHKGMGGALTGDMRTWLFSRKRCCKLQGAKANTHFFCLLELFTSCLMKTL